MKSFDLKYGVNPRQKNAKIYMEDGKDFPFEILNGKPGYINFMDALNSWQLVKEMKQSLNMPSAASFKHVSPAGAAVGKPLSESLKKAYFVEDMDLSPLASAYVRARGADRVSSFGDWAALSDEVDVSTAKVLRKEVSDGIIAPRFTDEALKILKKKKGGNYNIIQMDENYSPEGNETRDIFGITFEQQRRDEVPGYDDLKEIVTENKDLPEEAKRDLVISMITLKYTQSNSVCYVYDGQVIGNGAGQQSRIHCTRLAGDKADKWFLMQHPDLLDLKFRDGTKRSEKDNAVDNYLRDDLTDKELKYWEKSIEKVPERLTKEEKEEWLSKFDDVCLGSDAFFPFRDNIDRAHRSGVKYIVQPGGSIRDDVVIEACDEYDMVMAFSGMRLFHH
ncbi:MAG: phosphoribosylaminoimidazolecarboxamide formyltransferase [Thermoplasmata archaeon]